MLDAAVISLEAIQNMNQPAYVQSAIKQNGEKASWRIAALRDAALGVGARAGLLYQTRLNNQALEKVARRLDTVYAFGALMIQGRVVPPVFTETKDNYTQGNNVTLRLGRQSYKVEFQARFSSRPPHWRDYLISPVGSTLAMSSDELLPRDSGEQEVWRKAAAEGWTQGVEQAGVIFETSMNRLNRDFVGMCRYHILALKNMVTMPIVAEQNMPINASGDSMNLDETLLRITALPEFNTDMKEWRSLTSRHQRAPGDVEPSGVIEKEK